MVLEWLNKKGLYIFYNNENLKNKNKENMKITQILFKNN